ncbi:MAG TPA: hypothetical protein VHX61_08075 [Rhizomicrobium sp.]|nr:hypothetical protein [Rhizomicrobium sp.]
MLGHLVFGRYGRTDDGVPVASRDAGWLTRAFRWLGGQLDQFRPVRRRSPL